MWKLKINIEKSKVVIFSNGRMPKSDFILNGEKLEKVKEFNYLGIIFTASGSFHKTIKKNAEKGTKAMYEVLRKGRLQNLSSSCIFDLFDKIVKPILLYGCEIWGFSNYILLERVQLKFCKLLLNIKKSTPNFMVYGELGICPLSVDIKGRMANYWAKLCTGNDVKLSSVLYKLIYTKTLLNNFKSTWLLCVKQILDECGNSNVFYMRENFNILWLKRCIRRRILDRFLQCWKSEIFNSPKGLSYRIFKEEWNFEEYLDLLDRKDRINYCKFRTTNHHLLIEKGRWFSIERNNRKCVYCDRNDLGDEFHFLFVCQSLNIVRKQYLNTYYRKKCKYTSIPAAVSNKRNISFKKTLQIYQHYYHNYMSSLVFPTYYIIHKISIYDFFPL